MTDKQKELLNKMVEISQECGLYDDKQIIIDGVKVQDCCYFDYENDGYEDSCYMYQNECSANCNCYYKQLKAKEGELNKEIFKLNSTIDKYNKLKQTLTEIKEITEDQKDVLESMRIDIAEQILNKISEVLKDE